MSNESNKFPKGFLWGASTSAYQVEGGNVNDWSEWEEKNVEKVISEAKKYWRPWQQKKFPEMFQRENYICGRACDHCNRFQEDFDLAKAGGHNAHRFSIEWSRVEPEEGKFDEKEIEHYRQVIRSIKERGMEPFVCLWHWTNPLWLGGGIEASTKFTYYFSRYVRKIAEELGGEVKFWLTLNEPTSVIASGYLSGVWPPGEKSMLKSLRAYRNLSKAHNDCYRTLKEVNSDFQVGFANIVHSFQPFRKGSVWDNLAVRLGKYFTNERFWKLTKNNNDFIAIQYYFHNRLKRWNKIAPADDSLTDLGWEIYPKGIYDVVMDVKKYGLPIYITENGLADADDSKRAEFIGEHLSWLMKSIDEGADVRGYFHWSLMDNFEWDKGFWPRFGLIEIDYKTLERKPRKSFYEYKKIIERNGLE